MEGRGVNDTKAKYELVKLGTYTKMAIHSRGVPKREKGDIIVKKINIFFSN